VATTEPQQLAESKTIERLSSEPQNLTESKTIEVEVVTSEPQKLAEPYTVEVVSSEPQNSAEPKTIEVVAEGYAVEESTTEPQKLNNEPRAVEESSGQPDYLIEPKTAERSTSQSDQLTKSYTVGRAYDSLKDEHGGDHGNQYTVEVAKGQPDLLANPTTYEVVAKDYDVSPKSVQRADRFVEVLN